MTLLSSSPKLRKRMDARVPEMFDFVAPLIDSSLGARRSDYGVQPCGWLPLDVDTFAMDNGGTAKEGVGRTYAGVDGYCPLAAYLGSHGFCLELALRPGLKHSASETDFNLERVIPLAQRLSAAGHGSKEEAPILARLDWGFDSVRMMLGIGWCNLSGKPQVNFLIKWTPRGTDVSALAELLNADPATRWEPPRAGKRLTTREQAVQVPSIVRRVRRVLRLI